MTMTLESAMGILQLKSTDLTVVKLVMHGAKLREKVDPNDTVTLENISEAMNILKKVIQQKNSAQAKESTSRQEQQTLSLVNDLVYKEGLDWLADWENIEPVIYKQKYNTTDAGIFTHTIENPKEVAGKIIDAKGTKLLIPKNVTKDNILFYSIGKDILAVAVK